MGDQDPIIRDIREGYDRKPHLGNVPYVPETKGIGRTPMDDLIDEDANPLRAELEAIRDERRDRHAEAMGGIVSDETLDKIPVADADTEQFYQAQGVMHFSNGVTWRSSLIKSDDPSVPDLVIWASDRKPGECND